MVQQLIKAGADLDWGDLTNKTPLMAAAEEGHLPVVRALLQGGRYNVNVHCLSIHGSLARR